MNIKERIRIKMNCRKKISRVSFFGRLFLYFIISAIFLTTVIVGVLYIVFAMIPTKGHVEASISFFNSPVLIDDFLYADLDVKSGDITFYEQLSIDVSARSIECIDELGESFTINLPGIAVIDTSSVYGNTVVHMADNDPDGLRLEFDFQDCDYSPGLLMETGDSEGNGVYFSGSYNAKKVAGKSYRFATLKGGIGTTFSFNTPAVLYVTSISDSQINYERRVKEVTINDDAFTFFCFYFESQEEAGGFEEPYKRMRFNVTGDNPDYSFNAYNAGSIILSGTGEVNFYRNDNNERYDLHSQRIDTVDGDCNLKYSRKDGKEDFIIEGTVADLLISGNSRRIVFSSWIGNNIGLLPASLLTIFGGAISIALKVSDRYDLTKDSEIVDCGGIIEPADGHNENENSKGEQKSLHDEKPNIIENPSIIEENTETKDQK